MSQNETGIHIRPITIEDTDLIIAWRNDEKVRRHFIVQKDLTREEHLCWMKTKVESGEVVQFIIEDCTNLPIGSVYLRDVDYENRKAEYGIFIGVDAARGKGYGTQAAGLMLHHAFEIMHLHRVYLRVYAENARAIASYQKAGFSIEGVLKDDVFVKGRYWDIVRMAVINPNDKQG